jgi:hypothetical protein
MTTSCAIPRCIVLWMSGICGVLRSRTRSRRRRDARRWRASSPGPAARRLRCAQRSRSLLAAIPLAVASIGLTGVLAAAAVVTAADGWQWLLAMLFLAAAVTVVWASTARLVSAVRFFRLPPATAHRWSDLLLKEAVGVYFHDLYTEGYLPRAWFHDTFCRNQPISRAAFERLGTDVVTRGILVHVAMRRLPALQRAQRGQVRPPAGLPALQRAQRGQVRPPAGR